MTLLDILQPQKPPEPKGARVIRKNMLGAQSEDEEIIVARNERKRAHLAAKHAVIRTALLDGPATCQQLAERLGWCEKSTRQTVNRMQGLRCETVNGRKVWSLS